MLVQMMNPALPQLHTVVLHARTPDDEEYYKIVITMDETETKAVGVVGNGLIHYPFDFMVCDGKFVSVLHFLSFAFGILTLLTLTNGYTENNQNPRRLEIGERGKQMWDCHIGDFLSFKGCCDMIMVRNIDSNL